MKTNKSDQTVLYTNKGGNVEPRTNTENDTLWTTQAQIAQLFEVDRSVVTKHINNILKDKELDKDSVCANFAHTAEDGKQYLTSFYNPDVILSVGYRTNSVSAINFRKWATRILRGYLVKGFNLDKQKLIDSKDSLEKLHKAINFIESKSDKPLKANIRVSLSKDLI